MNNPNIFAERYTVPQVEHLKEATAVSKHSSISKPTTTLRHSSTTTSKATTSSITTKPVSTTTTSTTSSFLVTTTSSATSTSSSSGTSSPVPTSYSPGAAAGIGVGCAIAGAVIATLIVLFIMGRRRKSSRNSQNIGLLGIGANRRSGQTSSDYNKELPSPEDGHISRGDNLENILPQPLADDSVKQEVTGLFTMIDGHVVNYYHEKPTDLYPIEQRMLPDAVSAQSSVDIQKLLAEPRTRPSAITSIICAKLLESASTSGEARHSLLPSVVTDFLQSLVTRPDNSHAAQLSLSRWRVSTMLLRGNQPLAGEQEHRQQAIGRIIADLNQILGPYMVPAEVNRRVKDLSMLCERASKVGLILLSQPASWEYTWKLPSKHRPTEDRGDSRSAVPALVMFPGLVRTTDNNSKRLDRSRVFMNPKVLH